VIACQCAEGDEVMLSFPILRRICTLLTGRTGLRLLYPYVCERERERGGGGGGEREKRREFILFLYYYYYYYYYSLRYEYVFD